MAASQASAPAWSAMPAAISGRPPMRSVNAPAIGAMNIGIAVHGSVARPAVSGENPWTVCRYCVSRKIEPNIPKYIASEAAFDAANARRRKNRIGSMGAGARSSQATNPATSSSPPVRAAQDLRVGPPDLVPAHQRPDDPEQACAYQG